MKIHLIAFALIVACVAPCRAPAEDVSAVDAAIDVVSIVDVPAPSFQSPVPSPQSPISAAELLAECIARFPSEPFAMSGDILTRKMYGVEIQTRKFKSVIYWDAQWFAAQYEIFMKDGTPLETVRAARKGSDATVLQRFEGKAKTPAPAPALNDAIAGSDVTWLDISMDFVWWTNPVFDSKKEDKVKDRNCYVVKVTPPSPIPGCAAVKLWIDKEQYAVLQAVQLDEKGNEARKMWVRSVQKIDDRWLVKDIEVETPGSGRRTKIHVETAGKAGDEQETVPSR